jgi:lipoate-protein ligase A
MSGRSPSKWRLIDTGLRPAAQNIALDRVMLEAHQVRGKPHTLRFLRFQPSALVGFHQSIEQELDVNYCAAKGIDMQRRITGGGAIYFDPGQLGWELYLDKQVLGAVEMESITRRICEAAAEGIRRLGVDARFRPRNDIEVGGRKISGTGGAFDGDSILYQGTLLVDFDVEKMLRVLRIPAEKYSARAIKSARERVTDLRALLGEPPDLEVLKKQLRDAFAEAFGVTFAQTAQLSIDEQACYPQVLAEIESAAWVYQVQRSPQGDGRRESWHRCAGGLLRAGVVLDPAARRLRQVWLTGDFFVDPPRRVPDLEAALKDVPIAEVPARVEQFFDRYPVDMPGLESKDFIAVINKALEQ